MQLNKIFTGCVFTVLLTASASADITNAAAFLAEKVKTNDITMIGEYHRSRLEVSFFADNIKTLADAGAENFAFEFLPSNEQDRLDDFMESDGFINDRANRRKKIAGFLFDFNCIFTVFPYKNYVDAIENIYLLRHSGHKKIRLVGTGCTVRYPEGEADDVCSDSVRTRDEHMAFVISGLKGKTVFYGGKHHGSNHADRTGGILKRTSSKKVFTAASFIQRDDYLSPVMSNPDVLPYLQSIFASPHVGLDTVALDKQFTVKDSSAVIQGTFRLSDKIAAAYDGFIYIAEADKITKDKCPVGEEYREFINSEVLPRLSEREKKAVIPLVISSARGDMSAEGKRLVEKLNKETSPANYLFKHITNILDDRTGIFNKEDRRILSYLNP